MEVGALSRVLVAYVSGNAKVKSMVDGTLSALGQAGTPRCSCRCWDGSPRGCSRRSS